MKYTFPLLVFIILMLAFSCRPTKKIQTAITRKDTARTVIVNNDDAKADSIKFVQEVFSKVKHKPIDFKTFSAKIKVNYTDKDGGGLTLPCSLGCKKTA